jgi:hypothetical protein
MEPRRGTETRAAQTNESTVPMRDTLRDPNHFSISSERYLVPITPIIIGWVRRIDKTDDEVAQLIFLPALYSSTMWSADMSS